MLRLKIKVSMSLKDALSENKGIKSLKDAPSENKGI
jgi:hypothetical protein